MDLRGRKWQKLCNEGLNNFCSVADIRMIRLRRMRWERHVVCIEEKGNGNKILVGKAEGKNLLGRCRRRWNDNIQIDLKGCVTGVM